MSPIKPFQCGECGPVDHVLLNGYVVSERLLEGVGFIIRRHEDGSYTAETPEDARDYMLGLNEAHWLAKTAAIASTWDSFECPNCGGDIYGDPPQGEVK